MINPQKVQEVFEKALENPDTPALHIRDDVRLNKAVVEDNREQIVEWIKQLNPGFLVASEGGSGCWSSLNLCMTKDDEQWTDLQMVTFQLFSLASVLGLSDFCLPKEMSPVLPGGMPYVVFRTKPIEVEVT